MTGTRTRRPRPTSPSSLEALPAAYWSQMRRVRRPARPDVLIDHVLVGPSGIWVIHYLIAEPEGPGAVSDQEQQRRREVGAAVATEHAEVVSGLLPPRYQDRVHAVLCLPGDDGLAADVHDVLVTALGTFEHIVRASPPVLSTSEVGQAYTCLEARLEHVPLAPDTSRRRLRTALRVAAASVAVAAASFGVVAVLGPETLELFGISRPGR